MKVLLVSAMLSLGIALTPAAFAHNAEPYHEVPPTPAYTPQQQQPLGTGAQHVYDSGYGMEGSGSSNASIAQKPGRGALVSNEGRNPLFAHH
jgi:hypothetical protein